jgi:hypothetical protein
MKKPCANWNTVELLTQIERLYLGLQQETLHSLLQQNHLQPANNPTKYNSTQTINWNGTYPNDSQIEIKAVHYIASTSN